MERWILGSNLEKTNSRGREYPEQKRDRNGHHVGRGQVFLCVEFFHA